MNKTVNAKYDSARTVNSVLFDLIGTGISHENIDHDKARNVLKVTIAAEAESQVRAILQRHHPQNLN